jgi:hypothetical protein
MGIFQIRGDLDSGEVLSHPNKTLSQFKKDIKNSFKETLEKYLNNEKYYANVYNWTNYVIRDLINNKGYKKEKIESMFLSCTFAINNDEEGKLFAKEFLNKEMFEKILKYNDTVKYC